ncbi:MAG: pyridoxal phosphate-dependent aminotransferase [Spirochaetes bacterium]|nr:pyridoxal phosphate-dependent aminotransferase [Spirochaetota bacterium]
MKQLIDFDEIVDRSGTWSLKWDRLKPSENNNDVLPFWVADMDFSSPPEVISALHERVEKKIFGYTDVPAEYVSILKNWYRTRYDADVDSESILIGSGIVPSLGVIIRSLSEPGDGVLVMTPVYYPFYDIIKDNDRCVVDCPLDFYNGRYNFNIKTAEGVLNKAEAEGINTKIIILCSPHNPGGTVWSLSELKQINDFAVRNGIMLVSDEIHGDIICGRNKFISLSSVSGNAVVISGPNKSFNTAGLHISHYIIRDEKIRNSIKRGISATGFSQPNVLSLSAAMTSYSCCADWLDSLVSYLRKNLDYAVDYINREIDGATAFYPEGTYLIWVDVSELMKRMKINSDHELVKLLEKYASVKFTPGSVFGRGGEKFIRINAACPLSMLKTGLARFSSRVCNNENNNKKGC